SGGLRNERVSGFGGFLEVISGIRLAVVVTPFSSEDPVMMRPLSLVLALAILAVAAFPGPARAQNPGLDLIPEDALAGFAIKNLDDLRAKGDKLAKELQIPERSLARLTDLFKGTSLEKGMNMKGPAAFV